MVRAKLGLMQLVIRWVDKVRLQHDGQNGLMSEWFNYKGASIADNNSEDPFAAGINGLPFIPIMDTLSKVLLWQNYICDIMPNNE